MYFLHCGVSIPLLCPMVQHGFQVSCGNVPHNLVPDEREHLVLGGTFQPVVCRSLHRGEFENLEPAGQTFFNGLLAFIRAADFLVELGDIDSDFLLGFRFRLAGEHLAPFHSLLIEVPDDALPAAICPLKNIAARCESFLWHGWWFLPSGCFINHQHYRIAPAYVQPNVVNGAEKDLPAFW